EFEVSSFKTQLETRRSKHETRNSKLETGNSMMQLLSGLDEIISEHEPLAPHTWFNLGGPARWLARPECIEQLVRVVRRCADEEIPIYRLGQGANLLIGDDGVEGMVIQLNAKPFRDVEWSDFGA